MADDSFDAGAGIMIPRHNVHQNTPQIALADIKLHLQHALLTKGEQLEHAATLGQRVLAQQMELEERIRQLHDLDPDRPDDDDADPETRARYRDLLDAIHAWDAENAQLSSSFGMHARFVNGMGASSPTYPDTPRDEPDRAKASAGTSAAQSRRAKNAAHRADDVEFAFEIGSGLLTEVRRLQSLLAERDKAIQDMKEEKDDMDKSIEKLRTAVRQQEQSADKFKEENWNLEVSLQELRQQYAESQQDVQRLETEHKRITKALSSSRDAGDQHKNEAERLKNTLEEIKVKHETDVAQARKHAAGLQRDKSDLQQVIDTMKKEADRAKRLPRFGSPLTPNGPSNEHLTPGTGGAGGADDDVFSVPPASTANRKRYDTSGLFAGEFGEFVDDSPDPSPGKPFLASNHPNNEIEVLQQRLTHAQRQINTLKGTLQREKELKMDYRRKLHASPGLDAEADDDALFEDVESAPKSDSKPRKPTPFRSGKSRGGRPGRSSGLTLVQRLAMASNSPSSEFNFEDDVVDGGDEDDAPPVPPIPIKFHGANDDDDDDNGALEDEDTAGIARSPSPLESLSSSNRASVASVDGMDPMFANVLRRTNSNASSPLRQSVLAASARAGTMGRRRGVAYQEVRPSSLVGQPEALAAELGLGLGLGLGGVDDIRELREIGCQTEVEEEKTIVVPPVEVDKAEMGVQVEVVPIPAPTPEVVTSEFAVQTDEEPVVVKIEVAVQHERVEPVPILVSASMGTDPPMVDSVETQTPLVKTIDIDTQTHTLSVEKADVEVQTEVSSASMEVWPSMAGSEEVDETRMRMRAEAERRTTITQRTLSLTRLAELSGETTITGLVARRFLEEREGEEDDDDGEITETGADTEDEYHDAPQSAVGMSTPSESLEDFHSMLTMTDNEYPDSEDEASIKASTKLSVPVSNRRVAAGTASADRSSSPLRQRPSSFYAALAPMVSYESKEISAVPVEEPKPEMKETSMQTDEWVPPPPPVPNLFRVGSGSHQFQFISPPRPASRSGTSTPLVVMPTPTPVAVPVPIPVPVSPPSSSVFRDSASTFGGRGGRLSHADRRQSIESAISSLADESPSRSRVPSGVTLSPTHVDKTKPPTMVLPPPPRLPPPPSSVVMPPPSFIPERKKTQPPPRPSSPPPAELIQRATTPNPTIGTVLSVGKTTYTRQHGASMPPLQPGLRQIPSTSSFRAAADAAAAYAALYQQQNLPTFQLAGDRDKVSPRSSISSDRHLFQQENAALSVGAPPESPVTSSKPAADTSMRSAGGPATDPAIIHAITQTMIGEFLYKYTRRPIGKGHGERRHKRFFWVHPYTKTLYWSSADPGSSNVSESSAKSAYIDGVREVLDPNPMPPGLSQYSIVISTPQREMKFTAPTRDRHDIWLNALKYLLSRPNTLPVGSPGNTTVVPASPSSMQASFPTGARPPLQSSPQSQRTMNSARNGDSWNNTTPRGRNRSQLSVGGSIGKRSGTPAAEYLRWTGPESPYSPSKSFEHVSRQVEDDLDFELHGDARSDEGFEGLENVRACCEGRHTVGSTAREHRHDQHGGDDPHHHHHHHHDHLTTAVPARPVSPAWSFRSRTGSTNSHEGGGGGIFGWGRGEDGKLRFGSRRSTKTVAPAPDQ